MARLFVRFGAERQPTAVAVADIDLSNDMEVQAFAIAMVSLPSMLAGTYRSGVYRAAKDYGVRVRRVSVRVKTQGASIQLTARGIPAKSRVQIESVVVPGVLRKVPSLFNAAFVRATQDLQPRGTQQ